MSKLNQTKIPVILDEDNIFKIAVEQGVLENEYNWKLVREHDNLTRQSKDITWLEWNTNGTFKSRHDDPAIGRSLLMSPFSGFYTWQTTDVVEILEQKENYVKFKTKNSIYTLTKENE